MSTVSTDFPLVNLSESPIDLIINATNNLSSFGVNAVLDLSFSAAMTNGQEFTLAFNNTTITFTAATTPDNSGNQLPLQGSSTLVQWGSLVRDALESNPILGASYSISTYTVGSNVVIRITAITAGTAANITVTESISTLSTNVATTGVEPVYRENFKIVLQVYTEQGDLSGAYSLNKTIEKKVDANSNAHFDLSSIVDAYVSQDIPTLGATAISRVLKSIKKFHYYHGEKYGAIPVTYGLTKSSDRYAISGGLNKSLFAQKEFLSDMLITDKIFLNTSAKTKTVTKEQEENLYFMPTYATTSVTVRCKIYYDDSTEETVSLFAYTPGYSLQYQILAIPIRYNSIISDLSNSNKEVIAYDVWISDAATTTVLSEVRSFDLIDENIYSKYLIYQNSYGQFETLHFDGKHRKGLSIRKIIAQKQLDYNYSVNDGDSFINDVSSKDTLTISTGIKTNAELSAIKDLILSKSVFIIENDALIPMIIDTKSLITYNNENKDLASATLKISSANSHSHA